MGGETALALQGFGVGASATGAYFSAQGQKSTLNAQASIDETNAKLEEMTAQTALLSGQRQEQASDISYANLKASQKTAMAANGIDLGSGPNSTPVNVLTSTDVLKEVDAATIAANAGRAAFGARQTGLSYLNRARGERATASAINPTMTAVGSLISGAGTVAQSWYTLKKAGAFDASGVKSDNAYGPQNDLASRIFGQHNLVSDALY